MYEKLISSENDVPITWTFVQTVNKRVLDAPGVGRKVYKKIFF